jgi:hypothetical protein
MHSHGQLYFQQAYSAVPINNIKLTMLCTCFRFGKLVEVLPDALSTVLRPAIKLQKNLVTDIFTRFTVQHTRTGLQCSEYGTGGQWPNGKPNALSTVFATFNYA